MIKFDIFAKHSDELIHGFTTREGGFSYGPFSSLNLGFKTGDDSETVSRNYLMLAEILGINPSDFVFAGQVHGDKIYEVTADGREAGCANPSALEGADAMITNTLGIALVTVHADCAPVYLFDPVSRSAGLAHSGWKGTIKRISKKTVEAMRENFGAEPSDMVAAIGPSIGACCFETNEDVYNRFISEFSEIANFCIIKTNAFLIDLKGIIRYDLLDAGLKPENIYVSGLCTKCRGDLFYSHRLSGGSTGRMAAVMQLK